MAQQKALVFMPQSTLRKLMVEHASQIASIVQIKEYSYVPISRVFGNLPPELTENPVFRELRLINTRAFMRTNPGPRPSSMSALA